ncbi:MAG TPA: Gfo/Idh/MocA family oxidoreductase [Solirubrobacterales bacterium]|nr:Gfo/Idh/MocA family oxidoreductase [Solirubrobacterales bacterium]
MSETLSVGLVGCGGMGLRHLKAYAELERAGTGWVRLDAICDSDPGRLESARASFEEATGRDVPVFGSIEEAASAGIGAVDLAIPTRFHHTAALEAFELGWHVFVEKPIALTVRAARLMIEAAEERGLTLAVSENFRRVPAARAFRALVAEGGLGRPYWTSSELVLPASKLHPSGGGEWYRDRMMSGSLVALEMGVHEADLLGYWFGPIERVSATVRTYESEIPSAGGGSIEVTSEDTCFARFELEGGVIANVTMTMAGHGAEVGRRFAVGSTGSASSGCWETWQDGELVPDEGPSRPLSEVTAEYVAGLGYDERESLLPQGTFRPDRLDLEIADPIRYGVATGIVDFARAALSGGRPEVDGDTALTALAAAIALLESSVAGGPVEVEDVLQGRCDKWQAEIDLDLGLIESN